MKKRRGLSDTGKKISVKLTIPAIELLEDIGKKNETYSQIIMRCLK